MKYEKPPISLDQQVDQLIRRGMTGDRDLMRDRLASVNYYRLRVMSFGTVLTLFRGASHKVKQDVSSFFGMPWLVFDSWLLTLTTVRNICAHHGRLWNRESGVKPIIPRLPEYPEWHTPVKIENKRVFAILTICRYCLNRIAPQSHWTQRLRTLLVEFHGIPLSSMGFPNNWDDSPIWKDTGHV